MHTTAIREVQDAIDAIQQARVIKTVSKYREKLTEKME